MKNRWTVLLVSIALVSMAHTDIILDEVMSREEQKTIGVDKLSRRQKLSLETWLNKTFVLKTEAEKSESSPLSLAINIHGGKRLQLSDNSIWEIDPDDVKISSGWITPISIKISSGKNPKYPYLIINATSGVSVKARMAQPATTPPAPSPTPMAPAPMQPGPAPAVPAPTPTQPASP
jgi:hypothetical protein